MHKLIFFSIIILYSTLAFSQTPKKEAEYSIEEMIQEGESPNWIKIKEKVKIKPGEVFTRYNKAFSIREDSPMKLVDYTDDPLARNMQHYLYQQYHQGIKIYGAQVAVHAVGDEVRTINGRMLKSDLMEKSLKSSKPQLSE